MEDLLESNEVLNNKQLRLVWILSPLHYHSFGFEGRRDVEKELLILKFAYDKSEK